MDAKKKRNKKKKGCQSKNSDETILNTEETVIREHNSNSGFAQLIHDAQDSVSKEAVALLDHDKESDVKQPIQNGPASFCLDNTGVAIVESDKDLGKHKVCEENFVKLQETITKLEDEKNSWLQKTLNLEDKIQKMKEKIETYVQKEVYLGRKLQILNDENDMLAKKQVALEDKFERLDDIKYTWSMKESSMNSTIYCLEEGNRVLQLRVKELEKTTNSSSQENQRLIESLSFLESRIEALEAKSSDETLKSDETKVLEEINAVENIQLPKEEISSKFSQNDPNQEILSKFSQNDPNQERNLDIALSPVENLQQNSAPPPKIENIPVPLTGESSNENETVTIDVEQLVKLGLVASSEEITQDRLHDVEINEKKEEKTLSSEDTTGGVPLTDAPLIGAPFRLFSFVAKYVAGSDLVNETNSTSGN